MIQQKLFANLICQAKEREKKSDERIKGVFLGVLFLFNVDRD